MKKILLILISLICFSCMAQKVEPLPIYRVNAVVDRITDTETTLHTSGEILYASNVLELIEKKKYVFWIEKHGDGKVTIVRFALTTDQAQDDQAAISKELSHRKVIRQ